MRRLYQIKVTLFMLLSCVSAAAQSLPFDNISDSSFPSFLPVSIAADFGDYQPESQTSELEDRVQRLEAELDALRSRPVYDAQATLEQRLINQDAGSGGLYGSVEVTFLRPHISGSPSFFASAGGARRMIDSSYQTNLRYQLGYKSDSGFGVRGRYFSYDHDFSYVAPWAPGQFKVQTSVADFEATLNQRLRHFDMELSAGVRYGNQTYANGTPTLFGVIGVGRLTFEGVGPTASIGTSRTLGNSGFRIFGNLRGSLLFGDLRNDSVLWNMPAGTIEDEIMTIAENQLGVSYTRTLSNDVVMELRTAWETQYWMNSTLADDFYGVGSNLGLSGPTIALEFKY